MFSHLNRLIVTLFTIGCNLANHHLKFGAFPIYAINFDGSSVEFYCFDPSIEPPTFTRGQLPNAPTGRRGCRLSVLDFQEHNTIDFIASLRPQPVL